MTEITIFDLTRMDIHSYPVCPACGYEASYFLTASNYPNNIVEYFEEDKLEELGDEAPICQHCYCEIFYENQPTVKFKKYGV